MHLNGELVLDKFECKFSKPAGPLVLQHHGTPLWFKKHLHQGTEVAQHSYAVGIFLCPAAAVYSSCKSRFAPDISKRLRHNQQPSTACRTVSVQFFGKGNDSIP